MPNRILEQSRMLYSSAVVQATIAELAQAINQSLSETKPVVLSVMNGGLFFAGQLLPQLQFAIQQDYIHASRYGAATQGGGIIWHALPKIDLTNRVVLVLDDILDEGHTLKAISEKCLALGAKSVLLAVLAEKDNGLQKPIKADFVGLQLPNYFVFGCGMDVAGWWRNLPAIYALNDNFKLDTIID